MLCADLFPTEVWTIAGLQTAYVFFVVHRRTRTVLLARATYSPSNEWMQQQARNALWECDELEIRPRLLLHDNDSRFTKAFDAVLRRAGVGPLKAPLQAPNANRHAERWVRSARRECLNHLAFLRLGSVQRALDHYRIFFNGHWPHQGIGNRIPDALRGEGEEAATSCQAGSSQHDARRALPSVARTLRRRGTGAISRGCVSVPYGLALLARAICAYQGRSGHSGMVC